MEKKKALISVDVEAWEGIQALLKEFKISRHVFNELLNEFLRGQYKLLVALKNKKDAGEAVSFGDFLRLMGNIVDEIHDDQLKFK